MRGGVKFYRNSPQAARAYLEADHSSADDYYLTEGSGIAERFVATPAGVTAAGSMDGDMYEAWVAGIDVDTGLAKGRLRTDKQANRFLEVTVNGPKSWSIAAGLHPDVSAALDAAQDEAAREIIGYLAAHSTTRVGGRGKQVQVPVEEIEAAVIRHYTSRAGDPHRHLHLQVNTRVWAAGAWRGLHTAGMVDMLEAINGIGHAAVATNPAFRAAQAEHGFSIDPETSEIHQLAPFVGAFSTRADQIYTNIDRYETQWRHDHPGEEPGPKLRRIWDHRAWADARPDKVVPKNGADLNRRWHQELIDLGYTAPTSPVATGGAQPGHVDRDAAARSVIQQLGAKRSAWNTADIRGKTESLLAGVDLLAEPAPRIDLAEDISERATGLCTRLVDREDVPEHIRSLTSPAVLAVEADLINWMAARADSGGRRAALPRNWGRDLSVEQRDVTAVLAGTALIVVVEGAAGAGKTRTLAAVRHLLEWQRKQMMVVTPTLKAAHVAARETGATGHSAAWLVYQHGWRWNDDGHWTRIPDTIPTEATRLHRGDLLVVDEAGMLDQDTATALFTIADETGARIALVGDRHQLPAVGRGGVLDHAATWTPPSAQTSLTTVRRFTDPAYAKVTGWMRTGADAGLVFDHLRHQGLIRVHTSEAERTAALAEAGACGDLVIADRRDRVRDLNTRIRAKRADALPTGDVVVTAAGQTIGVGDRVATRRNDPELQVANRQTWVVTGIGEDGGLLLHGDGRDRHVPADYGRKYVELAYATTVYGVQGDTVNRAHFVLTETSDATAAYVAMTRGRDRNVVHVVAAAPREARDQWVAAFSRDRADLGPAQARQRAIEQIDRYGTTGRLRRPEPSNFGTPIRQVDTDPSIGF